MIARVQVDTSRRTYRGRLPRDRTCARRSGLALLLLSAVLVCRTGPPASAQEAANGNPAIEIPMELLFSRPVIRGTVNGEGPIPVLIDPQLQTTRITPTLADRLKLNQTRGPSGIALSFVEFALGVHVKVREARLSESVAVAGIEVDSRFVLFGGVDLATVGYGALGRLSVTYDVTRGRARLNRKQ